MKVLQVIHGYPPHYMAGSEVYTGNLVRELAKSVTVAVFTRVENPFAELYAESEAHEDGVLVRRINKPPRDYTFRDKYEDPRIDAAFRGMVEDFQPDVVHFGHLSHLSTNLVAIAKREFQLPVVFTIHDFWLFCFRGQLVDSELRLCSGPSDERCTACAAAKFKEWMTQAQVEAYRRHMAEVVELVDLFLAPSRTVERFFTDQGVPASKVVFSPYGFDAERIDTRWRTPRKPVRFAFLGRVIPVKGVALLIRAFRQVMGDARLQIYGGLNGHRAFVEELCDQDPRIELLGAYENRDLNRVLAGLDVLLVPSLWLENAPLVIQEAQLAGVPVVTSNAGGMAELVEHGVNGYRFPLGDEVALAATLQQIVDDPDQLGELAVDPDRIRRITDDAQGCLEHYRSLCSPRRLTVVTNPGICNMACPMCDTHSGLGDPKKSELKQLPVLAWETLESTLRELARLGLEEVIPSTMGEPLLYPNFEDLLALVRELGLTLNLTTNGSFPRGGVQRWAPALLPVLSDVKISLNGVTAEVNQAVMVGADTKRQRANVEAFLAQRDRYAEDAPRRPTVTIQATYMETNLGELPDLLRWAISLGVDRFKGHHLWVTWPRLAPESLRRSPEAANRWNETVERLHRIAEEERGPGGGRILLDNVVPLDPKAAAGPPSDSECPFLGREAWLEANGSFQVCCCPSPKRAAFGDFGNVATTPFAKLWASEQYRSFVSNWGDHPNCLTCNMRQPKREVTCG